MALGNPNDTFSLTEFIDELGELAWGLKSTDELTDSIAKTANHCLEADRTPEE